MAVSLAKYDDELHLPKKLLVENNGKELLFSYKPHRNNAFFFLLFGLLLLVGGFSVMRLLQEKETNRMWTNRVQAMEPVESEFAALLEEVVNRKMLDVFDLYCDNKNNHFHALLKSMEAQCPKSFKIQSITSDEAKVTINAISTDKLLSLSALQIQLEKIDGISSVKIDSITETNEALTKKKQYSYTITFAYNKVVDANEKASEIEGSQTE